MSLDFAQAYHFTFEPVRQQYTKLADDSTVRIHGVVRNVWYKLGSFRAKRSFLVVDMPSIDIVLGVDFCHDHDVKASFRKRGIDVRHVHSRKHSVVRLYAFREPSRPRTDISSDVVELCSLDAFAKPMRSMPSQSLDNAFLACVMPELHAMDSVEVEEPVLLGKGATHLEVAKILNDFRDVLVSEIPGGLPPVRCDGHGQPIEHTIEAHDVLLYTNVILVRSRLKKMLKFSGT